MTARLGRRALLVGAGRLGLGAALGGVATACGEGAGAQPTGPVSAWFHRYGEQGTTQALARYAHQFTSARVDVRVVPGDYDAYAVDALTAGTGPDVFEYANGPTIDMVASGQVADLTDLLGEARSDFTSSLLEQMSHRGRLYGIPQATDVQMFVYRPSLLAQAGVTAPRTLDELVSAARALNQGAANGLFLGRAGGVDVVGGPLLWSSGHDYLTSSGHPAFVNADVAAGLGTLRELFVSGDLLLDAPADWSDPTTFAQGRVAIAWTGLWALPAITAALGDDVAVAPFPAVGTGGGPSVPFGAYGAVVNAHAQHSEAARRFVQWLWVERTDLQLDWARSYGLHVPCRKSLVKRFEAETTGALGDAADLVNTVGRPQKPLLWTQRCETAFRDALDHVIRGGADPIIELGVAGDIVDREVGRFR
ncbi:extracellular solute-binding protein [Tsukamurella sp. 8F]|uniref:ABC transporter substrate-binding protein n=1 Tax=unclassified Tsukamurella TaxID=2633480 RepID=UPI0023BA2C8B|nr:MULTISPECIES: extracellular solute-binding protein [unclassified Tsukamurella]MDF0530978.1 extracellular solute-binding protein [Tsukamurella sp. 8J]MDF0588679.1 extracellular solute-binding protein [Tsukamurella sp. 8F]